MAPSKCYFRTHMLSQDILSNADQSVECTLLRRGIEALERTTRSKAPTHLPDWVMTEYDIDIDETSVLGRGGFAIVYKASWGGLTVAVKQMTSETSQKVCPCSLHPAQHYCSRFTALAKRDKHLEQASSCPRTSTFWGFNCVQTPFHRLNVHGQWNVDGIFATQAKYK
jgi:hypothetical protein